MAIKEFWCKTDDVLSWCNDWFDRKRKNNEMWRVNQDELSGMFLDELEAELTKKSRIDKHGCRF